MTAQKAITLTGVFSLLAATLVSVWSYARAGDPTALFTTLCLALASAFSIVQFRRAGPTELSQVNPTGARRVIAKFVGFAGACWLLIFVRVDGRISSLVDPLNALVLLASLMSLVLGLHFALRLRESRRRPRS